MNAVTRKLATSAGLIFVATALGACTTYLDGEKVETAIAEGLTEQTGLVVAQVTCPEEEPIEAEASFSCDVVLEDEQAFEAAVIQKDDEGNIRWDAQEGLQTLKGVIDNESLAQQIKDGVLQQLDIDVTTDCGKLFRIARAGETFTCSAVDANNNKQDVTVKVEDDNGSVAWEL